MRKTKSKKTKMKANNKPKKIDSLTKMSFHLIFQK